MRAPKRQTIGWVVALAASGGAGLGCNAPYEVIADRANEEPPALSRAAQQTVASAAPEPRAPPSAAPVASAAPAPAPLGSAPIPARRRAGARASEAGEVVPGPSNLKVARLLIARGIAGREPVGSATSFHAGDLEGIYAFIELTNEARAASEIVVTFSPERGWAAQRIKLVVGAQARWRTWALTKRARRPGAWTAVVSTADGRELARAAFEILP